MRIIVIALVWAFGLAVSVSAGHPYTGLEPWTGDALGTSEPTVFTITEPYDELVVSSVYDSTLVLNERCAEVSLVISDENCSWEIIHTINDYLDDDDQPYSCFFVRFTAGTEQACRKIIAALTDWWLPDTSDDLFELCLMPGGVTEYCAEIQPIYDVDFTDVHQAMCEFYLPSFSINGIHVALRNKEQ